MPALQDIFHENAQILSIEEAFNMEAGGLDYWMKPKETGVYITTGENTVRFPISEQGLSKDPMDILEVLSSHPALDVAQAEMDRVRESDISKMGHGTSLGALLIGMGKYTFPFFVTVKTGENSTMGLRIPVKSSKRADPDLVRDVIGEVLAMDKAPKKPISELMAEMEDLPPEIQAIIDGVSFEPK